LSAIYQFDSVSGGGGEFPHALLLAGVVLRVVGAVDDADGGVDLVFAAALLATVQVVVQHEAVEAAALVRADCVEALVLTPAVAHGTLVHVCKTYEYYDKNSLMHRKKGKLL